jgi:hypothetical protein
MLGALLGGLQTVGGWVGCAVGMLRRVAAPTLGTTTSPPTPAGATAAPRVEPPREPASAREQVEEAKFYLGAAADGPGAQYVDREAGELPRSYGRDRIVLMPRDPWWAFAYWEVTPSSRVRALRMLGGDAESAREVLRVYDVTFITFTGDNAWLSFDVELPPGAEHWYLNLGRPAASFCAEIGLRTASGRFFPLARSKVIATPRSSPSPDTTVRWVDVGGSPGGVRNAVAAWPGTRLPAGGEPTVSATSPDGRPRSSDVHAPLR